MANIFSYPFLGKLNQSLSTKISNSPSRELLQIMNNLTFLFNRLYIGSRSRTIKYVGVKTDSQVYLGIKKLF